MSSITSLTVAGLSAKAKAGKVATAARLAYGMTIAQPKEKH